MKKPMTMEDYELCRLRFGRDLSNWPDAERLAAEAFLLSADGQAFEGAEAALDAILAQTPSMPSASSDFLASLKDIPAEYSVKTSWFDAVSRVFFGEGKRFSPVAVASQAAVYLAVLGVGLMIGLQSATVDTESVDLSDGLFASNAQLFLEEE